MGQSDTSVLNTVYLVDSIDMSASLSVGSISTELQLSEENTDQLLAEQSGVHIRKSTPGGLANISYRGMSGSQLSLSWEGARLNSPSLGLMDLQLLNGNAIGSLNLVPSGSWSSGIGQGNAALIMSYDLSSLAKRKLSLTSSYSNIGNQQIAIAAGGKQAKFSGFVQFQHRLLRNEYLYKDLATIGNPEKLRIFNDFKGTDLQTILNYQWKKGIDTKLMVWVQDSERELPSSIISAPSQSLQNDKARRFLLKHSIQKSSWSHQLMMAHIFEDNGFQDDLRNITGQHKTVSNQLAYSVARLWESAKLSFSLNTDFQRVESENLGNGEVNQQVHQVQSSYTWWRNGYCIRPEISYLTNLEGSNPIGYKLGISKQISSIELGLSAGSHYRLATLNDKYWVPGGNPSLKPESGLSGNGFIRHELKHNILKLNSSFQAYYNLVKDWIQWAPVNNSVIWSPQNLKEVEAYGIELDSRLQLNFGSNRIQLEAGLYWNKAQTVSTYSERVALNQQLIYVPEWKGRSGLSFSSKRWFLSCQQTYTSEVIYQEGTAKSLEAFNLISTNLGYTWRWAQFAFEIDNLLDTEYELQKYFPLPGRTFTLKLKFNLETIENE